MPAVSAAMGGCSRAWRIEPGQAAFSEIHVFMNPPPTIALIACEVFRDEIELVAGTAGHIVERQELEIGLHDRPDEMRSILQRKIDGLGDRCDFEAIVLAYGLCGCGTVGLHSDRHTIVIPRAHDCITVFLGSKELYAERQVTCPGCYHYTPGWNRARRVPGPERMAALREEFAKQFDPDDVDFLLESEQAMWTSYHTSTFIDLETSKSAAEAAYTKQCADWLGWKFEHLKGDPKLLHDLLWGPWDEDRFQIIRPGFKLAHSPDEAVMRADPLP
jgi:hypothetical protein